MAPRLPSADSNPSCPFFPLFSSKTPLGGMLPSPFYVEWSSPCTIDQHHHDDHHHPPLATLAALARWATTHWPPLSGSPLATLTTRRLADARPARVQSSNHPSTQTLASPSFYPFECPVSPSACAPFAAPARRRRRKLSLQDKGRWAGEQGACVPPFLDPGQGR